MVFTCPSSHARYLRSVIATELARIGRDVKFRDGCDADLRRLAPIEETLVDAGMDGRTVILFGVVESDAGQAIEALAAARTPRETSPL